MLFRSAVKSLVLIPLVVSLFHIDKCTDLNSEPEKCYPTKRTIGSSITIFTINKLNVLFLVDGFYSVTQHNGATTSVIMALLW